MRVRTIATWTILAVACALPACGPADTPGSAEPETAGAGAAAAPPPPIQPSFEAGKAAYESENYTLALRHWGPLAKGGDPRAQNNLGKMYYMGQGVPQDHSVAIRLFGNAAVGGADYAALTIAEMHLRGHGTPMNLEQAYTWYTVAIARGVDGAEEKRAVLAEKLTAEQIATAEELARQWIEKQRAAAPPAPSE